MMMMILVIMVAHGAAVTPIAARVSAITTATDTNFAMACSCRLEIICGLHYFCSQGWPNSCEQIEVIVFTPCVEQSERSSLCNTPINTDHPLLLVALWPSCCHAWTTLPRDADRLGAIPLVAVIVFPFANRLALTVYCSNLCSLCVGACIACQCTLSCH